MLGTAVVGLSVTGAEVGACMKSRYYDSRQLNRTIEVGAAVGLSVAGAAVGAYETKMT